MEIGERRTHAGCAKTLRRVSATGALRTVGLLCALLMGGGQTARAQGGARYEVTVAATTDVHGRVRGWDYYANAADPARSLAAAATIVDSLRNAHPGRVVLVDAGDLLQGNPLTFVAAKVSPTPVHPVIAAMNVMDYDAAVIGNHEFNYGVPFLKRAIGQASFPFLAANVRDARGVAFVAPWTMVTRTMPKGGVVRIAIVGATTPGAMVWDKDNLRAAQLTVTDIVPAVRSAVAESKRRGADVVVVLLHSGLGEAATYDTVATQLPSENVSARIPLEVDGVDLVVFGHSHRELVDSTVRGTLLMQPRNWAASVAVASLTMERTGGIGRGRWRVVEKRGRSVPIAGHAEAPRVLAATTNSHKAAVDWANAPVGRTAVAWRADSARVSDLPINDLVTEVMRRATGAQLAAGSAFSLDASLDTGAITLAMLSKLYPYENTLRVLRIDGAQLRAYLEHSSKYYRSLDANGAVPADGIVDASIPGFNFDMITGVEYVVDVRRPIGSRISSLTYQGRAVAPNDTFTLALNNYRAGGGGGYAMLAGSPVRQTIDVDIRQMIIDEVRRVTAAGELLAPEKYGVRNWSLEPAVARAAAMRELTRGRASEARGGPPTLRANTPTLRVIAFSDFHAALTPLPSESGQRMGGAIALSAAIRKARSECRSTCQSIVVHAGDLFTGTPASDWDAGRPTVRVLNAIGVDAGALGNHELDFGQDTLAERARELGHPLLAANVRAVNGSALRWVRADTMISRSGIRIGIVGAAGLVTLTSTKQRSLVGLAFDDPVPAISARIRALRAAGAQVVIGLIHDGARCTGTPPTECRGAGLTVASRLTERPDAFVIGHSHVNVNTSVNGFPVVEPASSGRAIQIIDIPLDGGAATSTLREVFTADSLDADPKVVTAVREAEARVRERMSQPVATLAEALRRSQGQYALGNLIADAMRAADNADIGAWNNGGIRSDMLAGPINFGGVHQVVPFGNSLVKLRLTGAQLRAVLERSMSRGQPDLHVSGIAVEYDPRQPVGSRIVRLQTSGGVAVDDSRVYTMIVNDFMSDESSRADTTKQISADLLSMKDIDAVTTYLRRLPQPVRGDSTVRMWPTPVGTP